MVMPPRLGLPSAMSVQYVLGEEALLFVDRTDAVPSLNRAAKRLFDVVLASSALIALSVPMLVVAALVRLDGGPAIFGHGRVGEGGVLFKCLKFRSMRTDSDRQLAALLETDAGARAEWEATRKLKNDPRVTRLGAIIRKTGIDELPQLINVIRGEMSLVGPRPVTVSEMEQYGADAERYKRVRPGITGLWQVSGRNDTTYAQRVSLDAWYVANWSPWHDIVIILKTVPAVLSRRGAY
jgi:Undecaprenyl-phosphate galactose phosphotransferase WbaP